MQPISLSSGPITLTVGQKVGVDITRLQAHCPLGIVIDRIAFLMADQTEIGPQLQVHMTVGTELLTNSFVPVWNLGPVINSEVDAAALRSFVWNFKKPLYIGPASVLKPTFYYAPGFAQKAITIVMTCYGRRIDEQSEIPQVQYMPWCTVFEGARQVSSANYTERSTENHLFNPFEVPFHLEYMTGRIAYDENTPGPTAQVYDAGNRNRAAYSRYTLCRMWNNVGTIIVRDATPFSEVFDFLRRSWSVHTQIDPHTYYILDLEENWNGISLSPRGYQVTVGFVGYREVTRE